MTSACELLFDTYPILESKEVIPDLCLCLFQEADRQESFDDDDDPTVIYKASRQVVLDRLALMGFTPDRSRQANESWRESELSDDLDIEAIIVDPTTEDHRFPPASTEAILKAMPYDLWKERAVDVLKWRYSSLKEGEAEDLLSGRIRDQFENSFLWFDADDDRVSLRALLDASVDVQYVILDITALIMAGWIEDEPVVQTRREPGRADRPMMESPTILAEGTTDIEFLRASLRACYPHFLEFFGFFDHHELSVDGGAPFLVKFVKAFAAAKVSAEMIVIFDNDVAGREAAHQLSKLKLPPNFTILTLPDIELARAYETIGPEGEHVADVNGRAGAIELYLGRHSLTLASGRLSPVRWTSFDRGAKQYQGEVEDKPQIHDRFRREIAVERTPEEARRAFPELVQVWDMIFASRAKRYWQPE